MKVRENFMYNLYDFMSILLSAAIQDVRSTVQAVETKRNPVSLTAFSY